MLEKINTHPENRLPKNISPGKKKKPNIWIKMDIWLIMEHIQINKTSIQTYWNGLQIVKYHKILEYIFHVYFYPQHNK